MSSATPAAFVSAMSMMTTSASSFSAIARATVAPTFPAPPTTVTLRFIDLLVGRSEDSPYTVDAMFRPYTVDAGVRSESHSNSTGYSQFLLKSLLKTPSTTRERHAIPSILAVCTIVVRLLHQRDTETQTYRERFVNLHSPYL